MKAGDYGFRLVFDLQTDLSHATAFTLRIKRPDNSIVNRTLDASAILPVTPPAQYPTQIFYNVQSGDFSVPGIYQLEPINTTGGTALSGDIVELYAGSQLS